MKTPKTPIRTPIERNKENIPMVNATPVKKNHGELRHRRVTDVRRALDFGDEPKRLKLTIFADVTIK